LAEGL
jgi:hypothetical protein